MASVSTSRAISIKVFNRSTGVDGHLYRRRTRRLGRATQDLHSQPFLVQLALSDQLLTNIEGDTGFESTREDCVRSECEYPNQLLHLG